MQARPRAGCQGGAKLAASHRAHTWALLRYVKSSQAGESLLEVIVAVGILSVTLGAVFAAMLTASHRFGANPARDALTHLVADELRIAVDLAKYQGASLGPQTIATTVPMPGGSPLPAHLSLNIQSLASGGMQVEIAASDDADASVNASIVTTIANPAPLPQSTISAPIGIDAPLGAP